MAQTRISAAKILGFFAIALIAIQLYRPAKTNPPENASNTIRAVAQVPPAVDQIFTKSCSDCHSNRTVWPWYSNVAPVSWFVAADVSDGRRHINFSNWGAYTPQQQQRKLSQICREVSDGGMPLRQYTWMHRGTALDQQQRNLVCDWTKAEQQRITARTGVLVPAPRGGGMHAADEDGEK